MFISFKIFKKFVNNFRIVFKLLRIALFIKKLKSLFEFIIKLNPKL